MRKGSNFTTEQKAAISAGIGSRKGQGLGRMMSDATKEKISRSKQSKREAMQIELSASPQFVVEMEALITS